MEGDNISNSQQNESKVYFVIGPSGCGKSKICGHIEKKHEDVCHYNLDEEIEKICGVKASEYLGSNGIQKFGRRSIEAVEKLNCDGHKIILIDVGAGSQASQEFRDFIANKCMLLITAENKECHNRILKGRNDERSFEGYCNDEFSDKRKELYEKASVQINTTGKDIEESVGELMNKLGIKPGVLSENGK